MTFSIKLTTIVSQVRYSCIKYQCRNLGKSSAHESFVNNKYLRHFSTTSPPLPRRKIWLYALAGVFGGATVGAGYSYYKIQQSRIPIINEGTGTTGIVLAAKPDIKPSRSIISPTDSTNLKLVLYQYQTCPFCCKVRAFLDFYGFSYDIVEVNPVLRKQIKWSNYRKVPILLAQVEDGFQQLNDSTMIISAITSFMHDQQPGLATSVNCYPTISFKDDEGTVKTDIMNKYFLMFQGDIPKGRTKEDILEERKWRKWADEVLVHTLSPNVYRNREEAMQAFNWFSEIGEWEKHFSTWERYLVIYVGAMAMWMIGKRLKKRHNLKDDVRQSLYDECNFWVKQLKKQNTTYLGGNSPNLADLAVFGVLNSIEGCDAFKDLLKNTRIGPWYYNMKVAVEKHLGNNLLGAK